jgi:GTP-binding protein
MFVDKTVNQFIAGRGGNGCVSFRREKFIPKGGPDGGDGGDGGSIILKSSGKIKSLIDLKYKHLIRAQNGRNGSGANRRGKNGADLILEIPAGTVLKSHPEDQLLYDFTRPGQVLVLAKGGRGGRGNTHFKSSTNQAPRRATPGEKGESLKVSFELKLIAFAGLVGFPNAGKSTLISRLTRARPKVADYPFTTLYPNLGVCYQGYHSCVLADIPGIVPNAHQGEGMGIDFLRHIERTRLLIIVIDGGPGNQRSPLETYNALQRELALYKADLTQKPFFVVLNKTDLPPEGAKREELIRFCRDHQIPLIEVSALRGTRLDYLKTKIFEYVSE